MKKRFDGNTHQYTSIRKLGALTLFRKLRFRLAEHCPEFFLPIVLYHVPKRPGHSVAAEGILRWLGLTQSYGSPLSVRLARQEVAE